MQKKLGKAPKYLDERIWNLVGFRGTVDKTSIKDFSNWLFGSEALNSSNTVYKPYMRLGRDVASEFMCTAFLWKLLPKLAPSDDVTLIVSTEIPTPGRALLFQILRKLNVRGRIVNSMTAIANHFVLKTNDENGQFRVLFIDSGKSKSEAFTLDLDIIPPSFHLKHDKWRWSQVGGDVVDSLISTGLSEQLNASISPNLVELARLAIGENESLRVPGLSVNFTQNDINYFGKRSFAELENLLNCFENPNIVYMVGGASRFNRFYNVIQTKFPDAQVLLDENPNVILDGGFRQRYLPKNFSYDRFSTIAMNATVDSNTTVLFELGAIVKTHFVRLPFSQSLNITTERTSGVFDYQTITRAILKDFDPQFEADLDLEFGYSSDLDCPDLISARIVDSTLKNGTRIAKGVFEVQNSLFSLIYPLKQEVMDLIDYFRESQRQRERDSAAKDKFDNLIRFFRHLATSDVEFANVSTEEQRRSLLDEIENLTLNENEDLQKQVDAIEEHFRPIRFKYEQGLRRPHALKELNNSIVLALRQKNITKNPTQASLEEFEKVLNEANETYHYVLNYDHTLEPNVTVENLSDISERLFLAKMAFEFGRSGMRNYGNMPNVYIVGEDEDGGEHKLLDDVLPLLNQIFGQRGDQFRPVVIIDTFRGNSSSNSTSTEEENDDNGEYYGDDDEQHEYYGYEYYGNDDYEYYEDE